MSWLLCLVFCAVFFFFFNPTKLSDSSSVPFPNSILMLSLLASGLKVELGWKNNFSSNYHERSHGIKEERKGDVPCFMLSSFALMLMFSSAPLVWINIEIW